MVLLTRPVCLSLQEAEDWISQLVERTWPFSKAAIEKLTWEMLPGAGRGCAGCVVRKVACCARRAGPRLHTGSGVPRPCRPAGGVGAVVDSRHQPEEVCAGRQGVLFLSPEGGPQGNFTERSTGAALRLLHCSAAKRPWPARRPPSRASLTPTPSSTRCGPCHVSHRRAPPSPLGYGVPPTGPRLQQHPCLCRRLVRRGRWA